MKFDGGRRITQSFLLFIFFSVLLILLDGTSFFSPVRGLMERVVLPIKIGVEDLKPGDNRTGIEGALGEEVQMATLAGELSVCQGENEAVRRLLGSPLPPSWQFLPARVIGGEDEMMINQGRREKVEVGMVAVFEKVLVGRVNWTGEHYSRLSLPYSSGVKILVVTRSSGGEPGVKARGLLVGDGEKAFLDRVLTDEVLEFGDLVQTAGDASYPADLVIGRVIRVIRKEGDLYQKGEVQLLFDAKRLETVFVVSSY